MCKVVQFIHDSMESTKSKIFPQKTGSTIIGTPDLYLVQTPQAKMG